VIDSIIWTPANILSCTYCETPVLQAVEHSTVMATVYAGGCKDTDELRLLVKIDADIYIPNVFSPNGDGTNDVFTIFSDNRVKRVVFLRVFDRWGEMVFERKNFDPNDPQMGWDGTFKGQRLNPAVFVYDAQVELFNGSLVKKSGEISIIK
jgi:gliding motility-associated-like protein